MEQENSEDSLEKLRKEFETFREEVSENYLRKSDILQLFTEWKDKHKETFTELFGIVDSYKFEQYLLSSTYFKKSSEDIINLQATLVQNEIDIDPINAQIENLQKEIKTLSSLIDEHEKKLGNNGGDLSDDIPSELLSIWKELIPIIHNKVGHFFNHNNKEKSFIPKRKRSGPSSSNTKEVIIENAIYTVGHNKHYKINDLYFFFFDWDTLQTKDNGEFKPPRGPPKHMLNEALWDYRLGAYGSKSIKSGVEWTDLTRS